MIVESDWNSRKLLTQYKVTYEGMEYEFEITDRDFSVNPEALNEELRKIADGAYREDKVEEGSGEENPG